MGVGIQVDKLNAWFGKTQALQDINMTVAANHATAVIGPSGCGKSTFVRCLNRMHETIPEARATGRVRIGEMDVYNGTSAVQIRRRIGMVFQKANPFPTMSIYDNVAAGLTLNGFHDRKRLDEIVERSLTLSALWDEVKDTMRKKSGASLSGGQQQRLCIARAIAVEPQVLLMDEPCSALDPISTGKIEELIFQLKERFTIVIVTHNMQQASRVAEFTGFFLLGKLIEFDKTEKIFHHPVRQADGRLHHRQVWIMARTRFLQGLDELRARLLRMGGLAEQAVDRACQAYIDRDLTRCRMVLEGETQINIAEREIDELAFDLLAMQQPMAVDLRFILAVTKINADLERVGDQAVNIAERVMDYGGPAQGRPSRRHPSHGGGGFRHGAPRPGVLHRRQGRTGPSRPRNGQRGGSHEGRSLHRPGEVHERTPRDDAAGAGRPAGCPQSGARCRPRDQYRRRRNLLGAGSRCPPQRVA